MMYPTSDCEHLELMEPNVNVVAQFTDALARVVRLAVLPGFRAEVAERAGKALDRSAFALLVLLIEQPRRVGELAEDLSLDVSTASRQVQALEDAGYARRCADPADRRATLVVIEDLGREVVDAHRMARRELFAELLEGVPDGAVETAVTVLDQLAAGLQRRAGERQVVGRFGDPVAGAGGASAEVA